MVLGKLAGDLFKIINKGLDYYKADVMMEDLNYFRSRKRITIEEYNYLVGLVEAQVQERIESQLSEVR